MMALIGAACASCLRWHVPHAAAHSTTILERIAVTSEVQPPAAARAAQSGVWSAHPLPIATTGCSPR